MIAQNRHIQFYTVILVVLLLCACKKNNIKNTFRHDNLERTYVLYKPDNLSKNAPLVFVLHSYGRYAKDYKQSLRLDSLASLNNFMVCYPQGTLDSNTGKPYWNCDLQASTIDDTGYITELAKHLQTKYELNPKRTFVCGISNGGFMSYTLACESPKVFKAIASIGGTMSGATWKNREAHAFPISILQISGTQDKAVPIDGSMSTAYGWGGAPAMDTIIEYWSKLNRCTEKDSRSYPNIEAHHYKKGINNNQVWYYKLDGFGHDLPTKANSGLASDVLIWDFFSKL
ncbi:probable feruloyl esterase (CE1) [Formosa agariphila KMM 3901]|uniref:Probable feruloyl esterase (CE1) n=1 Tax=Formosa agariphila (strain DSM 15362 / KCTC 12365 / LMG 23005 / KMM 3901 / M-2Alg 35-1) TaxID=1347342 RepID=T2KH44_FORAG|nr:PHB depolymerase family esterase [Formosa agariphila]CDF77718.1 probable feruloyl esterase (CE1) [Formosa agariphila KMM 3901]